MADDIKEYNKLYYNHHKDRIIARRKRRYRQDKEFRSRVRNLSRETYRKSKGVSGSLGEFVDDMPDVIEYEGRRYYPLSYAADSADVSVQTIRRWHKTGIIPQMLQEETGRRWRWLTAHQLVLLRKMRGYNNMSRVQKKEAKEYVTETWDAEDTGEEEIVQRFGR